MAIEIYTRWNEVGHAAVGSKTLQVRSEAWHEITESNMVRISKNLPEHYTTYRAIAPWLVTFYRDSHVWKRTGKKMADISQTIPNWAKWRPFNGRGLLKQGQFRLREVTPTSGRRKAISGPMLWNARERKTSDSPTPAPGIQKSRALEGKMPSCEFWESLTESKGSEKEVPERPKMRWKRRVLNGISR